MKSHYNHESQNFMLFTARQRPKVSGYFLLQEWSLTIIYSKYFVYVEYLTPGNAERKYAVPSATIATEK